MVKMWLWDTQDDVCSISHDQQHQSWPTTPHNGYQLDISMSIRTIFSIWLSAGSCDQLTEEVPWQRWPSSPGWLTLWIGREGYMEIWCTAVNDWNTTSARRTRKPTYIGERKIYIFNPFFSLPSPSNVKFCLKYNQQQQQKPRGNYRDVSLTKKKA